MEYSGYACRVRGILLLLSHIQVRGIGFFLLWLSLLREELDLVSHSPLEGCPQGGVVVYACREFISPCTQSIELLLKFYSFDIETDHLFEVDSLHHFIVESFSDEIRIGAQYSNIDHE